MGCVSVNLIELCVLNNKWWKGLLPSVYVSFR